ncbi:hypothetical protein DPMN_047751 [Dreissena polymorpha]|uniref:Uncharacterized protein n=1 Tax=Dreissena polymorpha TaxID=45954 RepID=A0A9D4DC08_DREPO|nr:hypothetical protein DPMN_047751 [Dreissena polymorpha]
MITREITNELTPRLHKDAASTTIKAWPKMCPIVTNRRRNVIALYALTTLILNMLKTSKREEKGKKIEMKTNVCQIARFAPIGLDPPRCKPFSDRGLIGMIVVKSQLSPSELHSKGNVLASSHFTSAPASIQSMATKTDLCPAAASHKEMVSRRYAAIEEEQELHPRVAFMVKRTKEMQKQIGHCRLGYYLHYT